jgi:hypothetical protein
MNRIAIVLLCKVLHRTGRVGEGEQLRIREPARSSSGIALAGVSRPEV